MPSVYRRNIMSMRVSFKLTLGVKTRLVNVFSTSVVFKLKARTTCFSEEIKRRQADLVKKKLK